MSNYTKITNFSAKDALSTGNPSKIILGAEHDSEYNAIATAIATKLDSTGSAASLTALPAGEGGSLVLLDTTTASGAGIVEWDNTIITSTYDTYKVFVKNLTHTTTSNLYFQHSINNGFSYKTTNYSTYKFGGTTSATLTTSTTHPGMDLGTGYTTSHVIFIELTFRMTSTLFAARAEVEFRDANVGFANCANSETTASVVNAVRFVGSAGNISGTFSIYGVKK